MGDKIENVTNFTKQSLKACFTFLKFTFAVNATSRNEKSIFFKKYYTDWNSNCSCILRTRLVCNDCLCTLNTTELLCTSCQLLITIMLCAMYVPDQLLFPIDSWSTSGFSSSQRKQATREEKISEILPGLSRNFCQENKILPATRSFSGSFDNCSQSEMLVRDLLLVPVDKRSHCTTRKA